MSDLDTSYDYHTEVQALADSIAADCMAENDNDRKEAEELINETHLHETIDGHQWIIYNSYNLSVLQFSDNDEYMADNFGGDSLEAALKEGLSNLHQALAFWALYADVQEKISDALDIIEEEEEEEN